MIINTLLFTAAGFAGFYWRSWLPVMVVAPIATVIWWRRLDRQPLISLSPEQAARARAREVTGFVGALLHLLSK